MKKNKIKNTLSKHLKAQPSSTFTNSVMKKIEEEVFLKTHLKDSLINKAPLGFTANVIDKCVVNSSLSHYKPVIGKKVWGVIALVLMGIVVLSFRSSEASLTNKYIDLIINTFSSKLDLIFQSILSNNFLIMIIISISCLIMIESYLSSNKSIFKRV